MSEEPSKSHVLVTGGAGYVGSVLVPRLLACGHRVNVLDLYLFGDQSLSEVRGHPNLTEFHGDLRDRALLVRALDGTDAVIHLACISNDPSCELDPKLSRSINYDAFLPLLDWSRELGIRRFVLASSASVYGISQDPNVVETHDRLPVSEYNRLKALCEDELFRRESPTFTTVAIRPATICGTSPRHRLDLTVNVLTAHALEKRKITVFGGQQQRPNLHIADMIDLYEQLLEVPAEQIAGQAFNAGNENLTVLEIAVTVKRTVENLMPELAPIEIETIKSDDPRSYRICSDKIRQRIGFAPDRKIEDAIRELVDAFRAGQIPQPLVDDRYYNVRVMKKLQAELCEFNTG